MSRRFNKILVANRGEIACRVFRTAKEFGYATVAVYSDADADALHVHMADEAVRIGPPAPSESYLNTEAILDAAKRSGADAIHPGYGFLSENADFAQACADSEITFIGPPPAAIGAMGNKAAAKRLMIGAGVPCVPGYEGEVQDNATLIAEAERIGMPVLLKAAAGGGGRGMRRVDDPSNLTEAIAGARSEALNAFGSDELIIEKLVEDARHVEIQVLADEHGNCIHLGERDCSVQRRHQKIIEESPCPVMTPELRESMGNAAVAAAQAVGYVNAGTVEFMLDADNNFYFLEMNTRLQVEHPVTELVTGWDLVSAQLAVAQGDAIPQQSDVDFDGHAIEVRLYAEDPSRDFMPHTGRVVLWELPHSSGDSVRVDHGLVSGDTITPYYDPMIAKIIAHGDDRAEALERLRLALDETCVFGVKTNLELLQHIATDATFANGDATTAYLGESDVMTRTKEAPSELRFLIAAVAFIERDAEAVTPSLKGWRSTRVLHVPFRMQWKDETSTLSVRMDGTRYVLVGEDGDQATIDFVSMDEDEIAWIADGHRQRARYAFDRDELYLHFDGRVDHFTDVTYAPAESDTAADGPVKAPMAGQIVRINVETGQTVAKDDVLLVLEAMKMENQIVAPVDGVIEEVTVSVGDQVEVNQILLSVTAPEAEASSEES